MDKKTGAGKNKFSKEELFDVMKKKTNYIEIDDNTQVKRLVKFYNSIAVIQNCETKEIVTITYRLKEKKGWIANEG